MDDVPSGAALARAVAKRHRELRDALVDADLGAPSLLPGWSRLTIVCHLRYGAQATLRMSQDTLSGRPTSFYPLGRNAQRPSTLKLHDGERPHDVQKDLDATSARLDELWAEFPAHAWASQVNEPSDNPDLGGVSLWTLALLRLTEVEVHGTDLALGLAPWSDTFVEAALPTRLRWLPTRRSNHQVTDTSITATWLFEIPGGTSYVVSATPDDVHVSSDVQRHQADVAIRGSRHQLTGFLLGRTPLDQLEVDGNERVARQFHHAFPAP